MAKLFVNHYFIRKAPTRTRYYQFEVIAAKALLLMFYINLDLFHYMHRLSKGRSLYLLRL